MKKDEPSYQISEALLKRLDQCARANRIELNLLLNIICNEMLSGRLTVYGGELVTKMKIYETPEGKRIR